MTEELLLLSLEVLLELDFVVASTETATEALWWVLEGLLCVFVEILWRVCVTGFRAPSKEATGLEALGCEATADPLGLDKLMLPETWPLAVGCGTVALAIG